MGKVRDDDVGLGLDDDVGVSGKDDDLFREDFGVGNDFFGGGGASAGEKYSDLLKDLTDFSHYVKTKINGWLGLVWDGENNKYVRDENLIPIMNKHCAQWCIDFMKTYTRGNNIITDIGGVEYKQLYMDIASVVWVDLGTKAEEFGITNNQDLHKIGTELIHSALLVLMGAGDGKYNKLLSTATQRNENVSYQASPMLEKPKRVGLVGSMRKALFGG